MTPRPVGTGTRATVRRSARDRVLAIVGSEPAIWALVLGVFSAVAAWSGANTD